MLSLNVAVYVASLATVIWSGIEHNIFITLLIAAVWAALIVALKKMKLGVPQMMAGAAFVLVATVVTILAVPTKDGGSILKSIFDRTKTSGEKTVEKAELPDPDGTIVVDGKTGVLTNGSAWSNISDIERDNGHGEAYLGDKGATATYIFEATTGGTYRLWVRLSDDALHLDGARNVSVLVNNAQNISYTHTSEDTKGWKWYNLGSATIKSGPNTIAFTKDSTTSAAYVMNQFKLVP
jgi:hypothetical protein